MNKLNIYGFWPLTLKSPLFLNGLIFLPNFSYLNPHFYVLTDSISHNTICIVSLAVKGEAKVSKHPVYSRLSKRYNIILF